MDIENMSHQWYNIIMSENARADKWAFSVGFESVISRERSHYAP